jgi:hypothetical protein
MTILGVLVAILVIVGVGLLAYWIITKFLPAEWHKIALAVVGILLLIVVFAIFLPDAGAYRVFR